MLNFAEMHTKFKEHMKVLENYKRIIMYGNLSYNDLSRTMNEIYKFMKEIVWDFYLEDKRYIDEFYSKTLIFMLKSIESYIPNHFFIMPFSIYQHSGNFHISLKVPKNLNDEEALDWLTQRIFEDSTKFISNHSTFENECSNVSAMISDLCQANDITCYVIRINPGFEQNARLYDGGNYHYICIILLPSGYYLVDCSYRQFFTLRGNSLERIGIPYLFNTRPGTFMVLNDKRKELAKTLLERGWIKLTPENMKLYFDGFALSYRNSHYYTETGDYSYTTNYTSNDYAHFLEGSDNQVNHEGEMVLKRQVVPCQSEMR